MSKNYLMLMNQIRANLAAADQCAEAGDGQGAEVLAGLGYDIWDEIASDIQKGITISTDGWSPENQSLFETIKQRAEEEAKEEDEE